MKTYRKTNSLVLTLTFMSLLISCGGPGPKKMTALSSKMIAKKELQTSRFKDITEQDLLNQMVILIQDLGFQIIYANADSGIIFGEKPGDIGLSFKENMGDIFSFGQSSKQPAYPYSLGIIATTRPAMTDYLLRIKVMRIWRGGPHRNIVFANEFENTSLYKKIFTRFSKINSTK